MRTRFVVHLLLCVMLRRLLARLRAFAGGQAVNTVHVSVLLRLRSHAHFDEVLFLAICRLQRRACPRPLPGTALLTRKVQKG